MKIRLQYYLIISNLFTLLLIIIIGIASYRSFQTFLRKDEWVNHTHKVIFRSEQLISYVKDAETGQRGYLLSRDSVYLEPYRTALDSIPVIFRSLIGLTKDNAQQQQRLLQLNKRISERLSLLQAAITPEVDKDKLRTGKAKMDEVRGLLSEFIRHENNLLNQRNQGATQSAERTELIIYSLIVLGILSKLLSMTYTFNQLYVKDEYERKLQALNEELHASNEELHASNEELATSTEELMASNEQLEQTRHNLEIMVQQRTATLQETMENLRTESDNHRQTAEALHESENRLMLALKNAPISVFHQNRTLAYDWVYNAYREADMLSIIGKTDADIMPAEEAKRLMEIKQQVLTTGRGFTGEVSVTAGKKLAYFILSLEPIRNEADEITGLTGAAYEITSLKQSEENLKKTLEELRNRNLELDNYVYKVSHDLRAPLASILGLVSLIEMERSEEKVREYVQLIKNRINKSDEFIRSILNHSKIINAKITFSPIDFRKIIVECCEEMQYHANAAQLSLLINQQSDQVFYCDEVRLTIILRNFVSNAIKYINPGVPNSYLKFDIDVSPEQAIIRIEDNGMGIEEQYLDNIFDMFFRGTAKSEGSGLGLYIVQQTIHRLNGHIQVQSRVGEGTTFVLTLPNRQEQVLSA